MFRLKSVSLSLLRCNDFINFTRLQFSLLKYCSLAKFAIFWLLSFAGWRAVLRQCANTKVWVCASTGDRSWGTCSIYNLYHRKKKGRFIQEVSNLSIGILSGSYRIAFTGIKSSTHQTVLQETKTGEMFPFTFIIDIATQSIAVSGPTEHCPIFHFPSSSVRSSSSVTGVTYQLFSIFWRFIPWKPYIFWMHII